MKKLGDRRLEYAAKMQMQSMRLNHIFNKDMKSLLTMISDQSTNFPFESSKFIEIEVDFEIKAKLSLSEGNLQYIQTTVFEDYLFLANHAKTPLELRAEVIIDPRLNAILKTIVCCRESRAELVSVI